MKTHLIAFSIFATTAATVAFFPTIEQALAMTPPTETIVSRMNPQIIKNVQPKIEVVFVIDTTGSMGGLIHAAKEKIWSIASTMASAQITPDIKMGLVAYRDKGDRYVTKNVALSNDLDSMYAELMDFKADGGGDTPESVNQGLYEAVNSMQWSDDQQTYKVVFLVGDAPAHMDYQYDVKYPETIALAKKKGIVINAIQAGNNSQTMANWQQVAALGDGHYFQVGQTGNAVAISTPFDKKMAELSVKLDNTRLYYGNKTLRSKQEKKTAATKKLHAFSSSESQARRAEFNSAASGKVNFLGDGELVEAINERSINLSDIAKEELPASMQSMSIKEQQTLIKNKATQRDSLKNEIKVLAEKRNNFLRKKVKESGGKKDSLDTKIFNAIRRQSKAKGLVYDESSARY